ncbi:MAG: D-aminoacyl-tRNA deacylase [Bacteroidota bacterium]|nr:D-aminoacyl-tRNA deacylase [Bacteroidota bacterium]
MRVLIQRVSEASVEVDGLEISAIGKGLLVFLGIEPDDKESDADWLCGKISKMRLFPDNKGVMNRSVKDISGQCLIISQFTLHASTKKGNRPSYMKASKPAHAEPLYEYFMEKLWMENDLPVKGGKFGANMKVNIINDGPVTIWVDTKNKE